MKDTMDPKDYAKSLFRLADTYNEELDKSFKLQATLVDNIIAAKNSFGANSTELLNALDESIINLDKSNAMMERNNDVMRELTAATKAVLEHNKNTMQGLYEK